MKLNIFLLLIGLICFSCGNDSNQSAENTKSYKGRDLKTVEGYETAAFKTDFILSYILDSCQHLITFAIAEEDHIKITPKMYQLIKHTEFSNTCSIIQEQFGKPLERELVEAFFGRRKLTKVFRYKVKTEKQKGPVEVRIILTDQNKLTEFQFYEWSDDYRPDMIKMPWFG